MYYLSLVLYFKDSILAVFIDIFIDFEIKINGNVFGNYNKTVWMLREKITIKEIAKQLNISVSTVSRALRDTYDVSEATKKAVQELAKELDYEPNQLAKNLVKSSTKTIGVIVPNLGYYYFTAVIEHIEKAAHQAGYSVLISQSHENYEREVQNVQNMIQSRVEGVIISLTRETQDVMHLRRFHKHNIPFIQFDRYNDSAQAPKIIVDNALAAYNLTSHLIEQGAKRIAFLAGPENLSISNERIKGYKRALEENEISLPSEYVAHCDYSQKDIEQKAENLLNINPLPEAIISISDRIGFYLIHAINTRQLSVPKDIKIGSFNNEPLSALFNPPLTTIAQPVEEIGRLSVQHLLKQMKSEQFTDETVVVDTELFIRESSK